MLYRIERTDGEAQYVAYCDDKQRAYSIFAGKLARLAKGNYCHFKAEKPI
jgi:hypothetical protein